MNQHRQRCCLVLLALSCLLLTLVLPAGASASQQAGQGNQGLQVIRVSQSAQLQVGRHEVQLTYNGVSSEDQRQGKRIFSLDMVNRQGNGRSRTLHYSYVDPARSGRDERQHFTLCSGSTVASGTLASQDREHCQEFEIFGLNASHLMIRPASGPIQVSGATDAYAFLQQYFDQLLPAEQPQRSTRVKKLSEHDFLVCIRLAQKEGGLPDSPRYQFVARLSGHRPGSWQLVELTEFSLQ